MAVLIEGISVVIKRDSINRNFTEGWLGFLGTVPNRTFCADEHLARVGFMSPDDVERYVMKLESKGLQFQELQLSKDIVVVDQIRGTTTECSWLAWGRFKFSPRGGMVAAAWLCESSDSLRLGLSLNPRKDIAVPEGWVFEESLSTKFSFVPTEERDNRLKLIGTEGNLRIYRDSNTGELVYTAHERDNSTLKLESKIMPSTSVSKDAQGRYQIHVSEDSDANSVMSALSYIFADQTQHVQKKPFSKSTKLPLRPSGQAHMHAILHFIHGLSAFIKNKLQRTTANSRNTSRRKRITKPTCAK